MGNQMFESLKRWLQPGPQLSFETASFTHIGGRDNLEDAFGFVQLSPVSGCWVVADGVGGQGAGEVAARLAVETVLAGYRADPKVHGDRLRTLIEAAHHAIAIARQPDSPTADMASTIVVLIAEGDRAAWGHVGDSRLYHFREGQIRHRTEDQSLAQLMVARGALAETDVRSFEQRNVILHALGQTEAPEIRVQGPEKLRAGDGFLLCTDGVWELLEDDELVTIWSSSDSSLTWVERLSSRLQVCIGAKNQTNHRADNPTELLVRGSHGNRIRSAGLPRRSDPFGRISTSDRSAGLP